MNTMLYKNETFNRIEFWAATTIFVFVVFFHITDALGSSFAAEAPAQGGILFNYAFVSGLIRYVILFGSFLMLNFVIVPSLIRRESWVRNSISILALFFCAGMLFGFMETYLREWFGDYRTGSHRYNYLFQKGFLYAAWLLLVFGFYSVIRYAGLYLLSHSEALQQKYNLIAPGTIVAFILWMVSMFLLLTGDADSPVKAVWAVVGPSSILFYTYAFRVLLPSAMTKKKPFRAFLGRSVLILVIAALPVFFVSVLLTQHGDGGAAVSSFNTAFQFFIIMPLSWVLFKRHMRGNEEIYALKKDLSQSHASFDFLRSQINPHFLFNALNTIYGTAIQEGAERTGEGIERLGDMMRFMLQENMQEQIPLVREIEYLNNYVSLQKLRTDPNPEIRIETEIESGAIPVQIAPMLLIPFVENAFKHGISFREPSYIKVILEVKEQTLYFDVSNSKHTRQEHDPEKNKSGIGLNNVRQRLQLMYPGKHELLIRESKKDFFVHLTLQLT